MLVLGSVVKWVFRKIVHDFRFDDSITLPKDWLYRRGLMRLSGFLQR